MGFVKDELLDNKRKQEANDCLEGEILGNKSVKLRNIGGFLAVLTTCFISVVNAYITFHSVINGHGWPSDVTMVITTIGTLIIGWTFMRSNIIINSLLSGEGAGTAIRRKMANLLSPDNPPQRDETYKRD